MSRTHIRTFDVLTYSLGPNKENWSEGELCFLQRSPRGRSPYTGAHWRGSWNSRNWCNSSIGGLSKTFLYKLVTRISHWVTKLQKPKCSHLRYKFIAWLRNPVPGRPLKSEVMGTKHIDMALGDCDIVESQRSWLCPISIPPLLTQMLTISWRLKSTRLFRFKL